MMLVALYWLAAALASARAYELGFQRYQPRDGAEGLALLVAQDAGLGAATATAAGALALFLLILGLRAAGGRFVQRLR
jgi:hypothetical protein